MRVVSSTLQRDSVPRPALYLTLGDRAGAYGYGEAAPLPPFSREDVDACARALDGLPERLGVIDEGAPQAALARLGSAPPAARFAVETALLDLVAARRGTSVAEVLAGGPTAYAQVPVNALLRGPMETLAERAAALAAEGFAAIKIKLSARDEAGFARELRALHEVRARLPWPFELRLDPNAAWSLEEARRRLGALAPIAPAYVEQPVAPAELPRLGVCAVPWAADESLTDPALVDRLLTARGCAAFVIKPHALGLLRAREIALRAQQGGLGVAVTHFCDGPHAMAAACELALSLPAPPLACGLAPHEDLAKFAARPGGLRVPQLEERGFARSSGGPGLGVTSTWVCAGHG